MAPADGAGVLRLEPLSHVACMTSVLAGLTPEQPHVDAMIQDFGIALLLAHLGPSLPMPNCVHRVEDGH